MNLPKPTRRDCAAAVVGAIVAALLLLLAGQRWQVVPIGTGYARAYALDRWTGRAWYYEDNTRERVTDYAPE